MDEFRLTEKNGEGRYVLRNRMFYNTILEINYRVLPKLGMYEDIGTPEECRKAMEAWKNENRS